MKLIEIMIQEQNGKFEKNALNDVHIVSLAWFQLTIGMPQLGSGNFRAPTDLQPEHELQALQGVR